MTEAEQAAAEQKLSEGDMEILNRLKDAHQTIRAELAKVVVGQDDVIEQLKQEL